MWAASVCFPDLFLCHWPVKGTAPRKKQLQKHNAAYIYPFPRAWCIAEKKTTSQEYQSYIKSYMELRVLWSLARDISVRSRYFRLWAFFGFHLKLIRFQTTRSGSGSLEEFLKRNKAIQYSNICVCNVLTFADKVAPVTWHSLCLSEIKQLTNSFGCQPFSAVFVYDSLIYFKNKTEKIDTCLVALWSDWVLGCHRTQVWLLFRSRSYNPVCRKPFHSPVNRIAGESSLPQTLTKIPLSVDISSDLTRWFHGVPSVNAI